MLSCCDKRKKKGATWKNLSYFSCTYSINIKISILHFIVLSYSFRGSSFIFAFEIIFMLHLSKSVCLFLWRKGTIINFKREFECYDSTLVYLMMHKQLIFLIYLIIIYHHMLFYKISSQLFYTYLLFNHWEINCKLNCSQIYLKLYMYVYIIYPLYIWQQKYFS